MGVAGQPLAAEQLDAAFHHVLVEHVDVAHVDPDAHAMVAQRRPLAGQGAGQLAERLARLVGRRGRPDVRRRAHAHAPQMAPFAHLDQRVVVPQPALDDRRVARDVVGEQRDLGAARRRLLHDRHRHRPLFGLAEQTALAHALRLVHRVADERPAKDRARRREPQRGARRRVAALDLDELIGEGKLGVASTMM